MPAHNERRAAQYISDLSANSAKSGKRRLCVALRAIDNLAIRVRELCNASLAHLPSHAPQQIHSICFGSHADDDHTAARLVIIAHRNAFAIPTRRVFRCNQFLGMVCADRQAHGLIFAPVIAEIPCNGVATICNVLEPPGAPQRMPRAVHHQNFTVTLVLGSCFNREGRRSSHRFEHARTSIRHRRIYKDFNAHSMSPAA